jgi:acetolactate synthase-1/2/3 large subunit
MRVADYIAERLHKEGVKDVFLVTGGGMMFLSDGVIQHKHLRAICNHHEQASAMAAIGYAKYTENIGACFISTGCGATNTITGLLNAWQDNVPVVFVSGQVKRKETVRNSGLKLRQIGTQEADIISIVESISKYSVMVNEANEIPYHLEKAIYLAKSGRRGPVWLDIPMDVQGAKIDFTKAKKFDSNESPKNYKEVATKEELHNFVNYIKQAKRPVIIAGQGVRLAKSLPEFKKFIDTYKIPVVAPYLGVSNLPTAHPSYIGVIGIKGSRAGNLAVANADLVISLGSRLSVTAIGYEYEMFAREAKRIVVDIDTVEHTKETIAIDYFINADLKNFLRDLTMPKYEVDSTWLKVCQKWKKNYPVCLPEYANYKKDISFYYFVDQLSRMMKDDAVVLSDAGSAFYVTTQTVNIKGKQRYITTGGQAEMGYTIPASIGACVARNDKEVLGITGDGSFQMNIQELQTIAHNKLPVKIFVLNNNGYLSIRATQNKFFEGRLIGTDDSSGVSFPDTKKIAYAYNLPYMKIAKSSTLKQDLKKALDHKGPLICEVMCLPGDAVIPTASSVRREDGTMVSKPLEDMFPFLSREEFLSNMIVKPLED